MSIHRAAKPHRRSPASLGERVLTAEHPDFDHARRAWNLAVDQRPAAVITPASVEDVVAAVELARPSRFADCASGHRPWRRGARPARGHHPAEDRSTAGVHVDD